MGGKVELSLLHFAATNPAYQPPPDSRAFLHGLRSQVLFRHSLRLHFAYDNTAGIITSRQHVLVTACIACRWSGTITVPSLFVCVQVQRGALMSLQPLDNPLASSHNSVAGYGCSSLLSGLPLPSLTPAVPQSIMVSAAHVTRRSVDGERSLIAVLFVTSTAIEYYLTCRLLKL